jgi:hypothetical protein
MMMMMMMMMMMKKIVERERKNLKQKMFKKERRTYVYIANTDKDCDLLHDRPILWRGRKPHDKQNRICHLDYKQNLVMSPRGSQRKNGLTDTPSFGK